MTAGVGEPLERHDHRRARSASGLLREFAEGGVLEAADVLVAQRLVDLAGESDERVALAVALAVRAVRGGSVCVDLAAVPGSITGSRPDVPLAWPEPTGWLVAVRVSPLVEAPTGQPAVLRLRDDRLLYLDRYWREEEQVCADLLGRLAPVEVDDAWLGAALGRVFPREGYDEQRDAAGVALGQRTTVLTGGPGTGKTTTVAALLALLAEEAELAGRPRPRVALAAPTGKAAARLQQAVTEEAARLVDPADRARLAELRPHAVTLHRLLGRRPDSSSRFRHHRENRLPHDVVVVDETSMVSLTMMARLLEALRPQTRLLLVGDPDQLTSVEAGAVLGDVVRGLDGAEGAEARPGRRVAALRTSHRFGSAIGRLATAVREGDAVATLESLRAGDPEVTWLATRPDQPLPSVAGLREMLTAHAVGLREASLAGDVAGALARLDDQRLLCAHREGPYGVRRWNEYVERWLDEAVGSLGYGPWYAGRPLLVSANDYGLGLYNGDVGVCVPGTGRHTGLRAHVAATPAPVDVAVGRLGEVETMHAMTIHKSQGSQATKVVVVLPPPESRLLTRELLYTAITRARETVVLVGSEADVVAAVERRATRATGLQERLRG